MSSLLQNAQRFLQLMDAMGRRRHHGAFERFQALNLSFAHMRALHVLRNTAPIPMKELAEQLGITPPSVTALTRRLSQTGLIERLPHPDDSRVVLLAITEDGQTLIRDLEEGRLQHMMELLSGLTDEQQVMFIDLMEQAVRAHQQPGDMAADA